LMLISAEWLFSDFASSSALTANSTRRNACMHQALIFRNAVWCEAEEENVQNIYAYER
jgi:hypothetical protein